MLGTPPGWGEDVPSDTLELLGARRTFRVGGRRMLGTPQGWGVDVPSGALELLGAPQGGGGVAGGC